MKKLLIVAALPFVIAGCTPGWDMHGNDPKEVYKKEPVKNTVESRNMLKVVHFPSGASRLSRDGLDDLKAALSSVSPEAVEAVKIQLPASQMKNEAKRQHLTKFLRNMGYKSSLVSFEESDSVERNDARIDVKYAYAVGPKCPDWRTSPVTTYSNTGKGGMGCATVTNLGAMVADPRDLERGNGLVSPDMTRNSIVLENYHDNVSAAPSSGSSSTSTTPTR